MLFPNRCFRVVCHYRYWFHDSFGFPGSNVHHPRLCSEPGCLSQPGTLFSCIFVEMGRNFLPMGANGCRQSPASSGFRKNYPDWRWYKAGCGWEGDESVCHVIQMLRDGFRAAVYFGQNLFVLERYFLTVPLLKEWQSESRPYPGLIHVMTRAKKNCIAYEQQGEYKGRGRRPVKGAAVRLQEIFSSCSSSFRSVKLPVYGKIKDVRYLSRTYLWGQNLYQS